VYGNRHSGLDPELSADASTEIQANRRYSAPLLPKGDLSFPLRQNGPIDFDLAAHFHFLLPASLGRTLADCSIDEPAQMSGIKLPCGAVLSFIRGAIMRQPARLDLFGSVAFQSKNKEDLTLDMHKDFPPALFKALNGFCRNAHNLCHLVLRLPQIRASFCKLSLLHVGMIPR
jgi:hypothetical protein